MQVTGYTIKLKTTYKKQVSSLGQKTQSRNLVVFSFLFKTKKVK